MIIVVAAAWAALKKTAVAAPIVAASIGVTLPMLFGFVGEFLGPHIIAAIGAVMGSAIRFHLFKTPWRTWRYEALAAAGLGLAFGQATVPGVSHMLGHVSPEIFPLSNGTAIGILMSLAAGWLTDMVSAYRDKMEGRKP